MRDQIVGGILLASHVVRSVLFGHADPLVHAQLEQLRLDVRAMSRSIILHESEGELCDWKLWRSDVFLKCTILFDVLLVVFLVWWYHISSHHYLRQQRKQPLALPGYDISGSRALPSEDPPSAAAFDCDFAGLAFPAPAPAAAKAIGRPGRPSDFGFRPVA